MVEGGWRAPDEFQSVGVAARGGEQSLERERIKKDFADMREARFTVVRTYTLAKELLTFTAPEDVVAGVRDLGPTTTRTVWRRSLAEEYFDSDRVVGALLAQFGLA